MRTVQDWIKLFCDLCSCNFLVWYQLTTKWRFRQSSGCLYLLTNRQKYGIICANRLPMAMMETSTPPWR